MLENRENYEALLRDQVSILEWSLGHRVAHGEAGVCPKCGQWGHYDLDGLGFDPAVDNAIYYSTVFDQWRCQVCDFKICY